MLCLPRFAPPGLRVQKMLAKRVEKLAFHDFRAMAPSPEIDAVVVIVVGRVP